MALTVALLGGNVQQGPAAESRGPGTAGETAVHVEHILVTDVRDADQRPVAETQNVLSPETVARFDASSGADILRRMPSLHVPTNSRGESIVFLRNAGERQVAVFLGGAMLNVPWDNRFDMGMLPGYLVGSVLSASGPIPASYGVNALGVINVVLPEYRSGGSFINEWGEEGAQRHEALWSGSLNGAQLLGAGAYVAQDGEPVADPERTPFYQADPDRRTNTDREFLGFAGRAGFEVGRGRLDATLIISHGEKGIAPESHLASGNRFWRYPQHRLVQGNFHADIDFSPRVNLTASAWMQDFRQTIDQYADATYSMVLDREEGEDRTYGARAILASGIGDRSQVALSCNLLASTHVQRDTPFVGGGAPPPESPPWLTYRQRAMSFGADFEHRFTDALVGELGAGVDWLTYTRTGDKPSVPDFIEPTVYGGLGYDVDEHWRLRFGAGYKTRSPTMRDMFGVALNRFLLNPDLTPERVVNVEAGAEWTGTHASFAAIPFAQFVDSTIDQRNVGALRQRINLRGSEIFGIEVNGTAKLSEQWTVTGSLTASRVRRLRSTSADSVHLAEKPALLAGLSIDYIGPGFEAGLELDHTGRAYSASVEGTMVPLAVSTQVNARLAFNLDHVFTALPSSQLYIRADNLTDAFVEPQLGIAAAGRWIRAGYRVRW